MLERNSLIALDHHLAIAALAYYLVSYSVVVSDVVLVGTVDANQIVVSPQIQGLNSEAVGRRRLPGQTGRFDRADGSIGVGSTKSAPLPPPLPGLRSKVSAKASTHGGNPQRELRLEDVAKFASPAPRRLAPNSLQAEAMLTRVGRVTAGE